jgi:hypothetical protein
VTRQGMFKPTFHAHCQHTLLPIQDSPPHFKGFPAAFGGSGEQVPWCLIAGRGSQGSWACMGER